MFTASKRAVFVLEGHNMSENKVLGGIFESDLKQWNVNINPVFN
jgi:hypothetical protein